MQNKLAWIIGLIIIIAGGWWYVSSQHTAVVEKIPLTEKAPFNAELAVNPAQPLAGQDTQLTFTFTNADGSPVSDLMQHHDRLVHVLIIGADLMTLGHIHPSDFKDLTDQDIASGVYSVNYSFPEAGRYIVAVDVMNASGMLSQRWYVNVGGSPRMGATLSDDASQEKCFASYATQEKNGLNATERYVDPYFIQDSHVECPQGYKVTFTPASDPIVAGKETFLRYKVERDGEPVTDMEPYLGAPIHLAVVSKSLDTLLHVHGNVDEGMEGESDSESSSMNVMSSMNAMSDHHDDMAMGDSGSAMEGMDHHDDVPATFGPYLISDPIIFPKAGTYWVFGQFKHHGEIVLSAFEVTVEAGQQSETSSAAATKTFDLVVENRKITSGPTTLSVKEGDTVTINITADEDEELHLHGYNKMVDLEKGVPASLTFEATASGRFPFELEHSKTDLGAVEVQP